MVNKAMASDDPRGKLLKLMLGTGQDMSWVEFRCRRDFVLCFELKLSGRRLSRSLFFASDYKLSMHELVSSKENRDIPLPLEIEDCAGESFLRVMPHRTVVFHRNKGRGNKSETFVPSEQLCGLLPSCLLRRFSFWKPVDGSGIIFGEPASKSSSFFNYSLEMRLVAGCADVVRRDPDGTDYYLLDLSRAHPGSLLQSLARTFCVFEPMSHVLAWTEAAPLPGDRCALKMIELPRLGLKFSPSFDALDARWRLYSSDYSGELLTAVATANVELQVRMHICDFTFCCCAQAGL
eukprot:SAG11_NODE_68_length_18649_cov_29.058005_5_plen_292_part_00